MPLCRHPPVLGWVCLVSTGLGQCLLFGTRTGSKEIKQRINTTAAQHQLQEQDKGGGASNWNPCRLSNLKHKTRKTQCLAPWLNDTGWWDYHKKEDKVIRSLLFLFFVVFISVLLRWVIRNSVTVTVPHLFFMIAVGSIAFIFCFLFGYSNFVSHRMCIWFENTSST